MTKWSLSGLGEFTSFFRSLANKVQKIRPVNKRNERDDRLTIKTDKAANGAITEIIEICDSIYPIIRNRECITWQG